jgi:hypothetical protein
MIKNVRSRKIKQKPFGWPSSFQDDQPRSTNIFRQFCPIMNWADKETDMHIKKRLVLRAILGFLPPIVLIGINIARCLQFYFPQTCFDCGVRIGFPLGFWQSEMYAGGNQILWLGLLADIAFVVLLFVIGILIADSVCRCTARKE